MQVAGIDLAWGSRARTGVALTDEHGALVKSASVTTDEQIADFLSGSLPAVIAIDAPIIVTNASGMRDCERDLSKDFRRFHAGTHPTNMSRPSMQPEPRAKRLLQTHGWTADVGLSPGPLSPVAIEVYPHSSMVGLFGLDRVIAYKGKRGRTLDSRAEQFDRLFDLMELHCDDPLRLTERDRWHELRHSAREAKTQSRLNLIEDELDAIFCAYVAWVFVTTPAALVTYGAAEGGVIVTFPPPA
jgi:predicted RNase H-like nuclease